MSDARVRNPVVLGRKFCTKCGRWRHVVDFYPNRRWPDGEVRDWQSRCSTCQRVARRERLGFGPRPPKLSRAQRLARWKERYRARMADPVWLELHREYDRIYKEAKRREAGIPARDFRKRAPRGPRGFVPVEPIRAEVKLWEGTYEGLARRSGVPARTIYRIRYGECTRVEAYVADRLALALGVTASLVYGEAWAAA